MFFFSASNLWAYSKKHGLRSVQNFQRFTTGGRMIVFNGQLFATGLAPGATATTSNIALFRCECVNEICTASPIVTGPAFATVDLSMEVFDGRLFFPAQAPSVPAAPPVPAIASRGNELYTLTAAQAQSQTPLSVSSLTFFDIFNGTSSSSPSFLTALDNALVFRCTAATNLAGELCIFANDQVTVVDLNQATTNASNPQYVSLFLFSFPRL